jgi:competence protein ComGC
VQLKEEVGNLDIIIGKLIEWSSQGENMRTLIELLLVVSFLVVIAIVAVPKVVRFINRGKTESYEAELD